MFGDLIITSLLHNPTEAITTLICGLAATMLLRKLVKYLVLAGVGFAVFTLLGQTH